MLTFFFFFLFFFALFVVYVVRRKNQRSAKGKRAMAFDLEGEEEGQKNR